MQTPWITLIGPGGAGKSTVGALLAERLGVAFVDLDRRFADQNGDVSEYIDQCGYDAYARQNVETYHSVLQKQQEPYVAALSSGFMTYPRGIHPDYARLCRDIAQSPTTCVLIPSLDPERCVKETVRRQLARAFARSPMKEEAVIRQRFRLFVGLPVRKIETMRPLSAIVDEIVRPLRAKRPITVDRFANSRCCACRSVGGWGGTLEVDAASLHPGGGS